MEKLKLHPFMLIYIFVCLYFDWTNIIFFYVVSVLVHEYGHLLTAKMLGYTSAGVVFNVTGAYLNSHEVFKDKDDIIISLAGPLVNLIIIIISLGVWWLFPSLYIFTSDWVVANLWVMIFNLIPIYPLDGGRVVKVLLSKRLGSDKFMKYNSALCFVFGVLLLSLFFVSVFININFSLLFMGVFMTINGIVCDNNPYFKSVSTINKDMKKNYEIKIFKVNNIKKCNLVKLIKPNYYSVFMCNINGCEKIIKEEDLLK